MKAAVLKEKAMDMIEGLPEDKLKDAVDYLKYLKGDYDAFSVNEKIKQSLCEVKLIKEGKTKPKALKEFLREL
ncbi:MAG: hypothetical protein C4550_00165 [Nitrospiraceae bacterium]|nr:MAG: hypothetical protein C4550_00165 [Nitrospiraceae bacterium]